MPTSLRAILIFVFTYVLISGWKLPGLRLNRPAGTMAGAVLMVICGVLTPEQAYATIQLDTIVLLLGTMILSEFLKHCGFYSALAARLRRARLSPSRLLAVVVVLSGLLSAFLVNDTVCFMFTPLVLAIIGAAGLPPVPYLMALATSSNIGSALTLTGNPQNMLIGDMSGIPYLLFTGALAAPVSVSLTFNFLLLRWYYKRELSTAAAPSDFITETPVDRVLLWKSLFCLALSVAGFIFTKHTGLNLAWTSITAAVLLLTIGKTDPYKILAGVDWTLLLFFAGLFIVIGGLSHTGILNEIQEHFARPLLGESVERQSLHLTWLTIAGSQIFSNVPYVLVTGHWIPSLTNPPLAWTLLGFVATVSGNLTILGSVANVIVLEQARDRAKISFFDYLKFGILTTTVSVVTGVLFLFIEHRLGFFR